MCGRVCCTLNATQVARACGIPDNEAGSVRAIQMDQFRPSYNVSPGSYFPVFTAADVKGQAAQVDDACHAVHCMKWGLVPSFTKKTEKLDHYRMFNARSESVKEKPSFRRLIPNNRCLVAVEGFYEWKKDGSKKQPYYIHFKDGRPLVFAALYDSWKNSEDEILYTFTILTTRSSPALEWLHDRMPVIFGSKVTPELWLISDSQAKFETVLTPYADSDLVWYPVTPAIGKPSFDGPECIKEIPLKLVLQNQISKLFSRKTDNIHKRKSEPYVFPENVKPNNLKEDPATEDIEELADVKKVIHEEFHGIKREFEDMVPDLEFETEVPEGYPTSVKKKSQTGDKQISLLSYFEKK